MSKQKFTGKKQAAVKGPIDAPGVPAKDSNVTSHQVMASKDITNMRRK